MTQYIVHIYREMKLTFRGIEAESSDAAADKARDLDTGEADSIDDCDGETLAALVDVVGDEEYRQSRLIDFEPERKPNAARHLLKALTACVNYMADDLDESDETEARIFRQACAAIAKGGALPASSEQTTAGVPTEALERGLIRELLEGIEDLLGDLPSVREGVCRHCGREYHDILCGDCPSDDCPSFKGRAAIAKARAVTPLPERAAAGQPIVAVSVRGGLIDDIDATMPVTVVVEDWDVQDYDTNQKPTQNIWALPGGMSDAKADKFRRLIDHV